MDKERALSAFDALSQATRLDVLRLLVRAGPDGMAAGDIATALDIRQNTLSTHLRLLANAELITAARNGRSIIYSASYAAIRDLTLFLLQDCCGGETAVCKPVAKALRGKRC